MQIFCVGREQTFQLNFSMSTEDGASTKRQKAQAMLGQLREGGGVDGGGAGGTEGWEEVSRLLMNHSHEKHTSPALATPGDNDYTCTKRVVDLYDVRAPGLIGVPPFPLQAWALIRASTGIADPDLFIQKHLNCDHLETQLMELKQVRKPKYTP